MCEDCCEGDVCCAAACLCLCETFCFCCIEDFESALKQRRTTKKRSRNTNSSSVPIVEQPGSKLPPIEMQPLKSSTKKETKETNTDKLITSDSEALVDSEKDQK